MLEYDRTDISKGTILIKQMHPKSVTFVIIGILYIKTLNMNHILTMIVII